MAKIARRQLARQLVRILSEQPKRKTELLRQVAAYLIQTKQANQAHLLMADIANEQLASQKVLNAEVISAFKLSDSSRQAVIGLLKRTTGANTVELDEQVQPNLLGGVVVRTAQLELDASVKRQLTQLAGGI